MQTKIFTGNSAKEALAMVKQELGSEAVILTSRQIEENGVKRYQVTARLEEPEITPNEAASSGSQGFDDMRREWSDLREHILALLKPELRMEVLTPPESLFGIFATRRRGRRNHCFPLPLFSRRARLFCAYPAVRND